eukprot:gene12876-17254_t
MSVVAFQAKYSQYNLQYERLNDHLNSVKRKFGLKKVSSTRSLTSSNNGETRTFAELLDHEVEKIVLFYLRMQGELAEQVWSIRSKQISELEEIPYTLDDIEIYCQKYRDVAFGVFNLLTYLEKNVNELRRLIQKYDSVFDHKVGSMYFDTRLGRDPKNSQLLQLYHQEGLRAVIGTIRRAFEDLYEARSALINMKDDYFHDEQSDFFGPAFNSPSIGFGDIYSRPRNQNHLPRISYKNRLQSFSSLQSLQSMGNIRNEAKSSLTAKSMDPTMQLIGLESGQGHVRKRSKSIDGGLKLFTFGSISAFSSEEPENRGMKRTISDLEPILKKITTVADRVLQRYTPTTHDVLAANSIIALDLTSREMQTPFIEEADERKTPISAAEVTAIANKERIAKLTLYINLFATFLYMANQYIVGPTSGKYSDLLHMPAAMSGLVIGLSPVGALFSSLIYSKWTNYSFKNPLITCVFFGIVGNLLYATALQCNSSTMMFLGRICTGLSGPRVIARRYIADHVPLKDLTVASSEFVTAGAMGLAAGPLLSSIIQRWNVNFSWKSVEGTTYMIYRNETAPGWIMLIFWILSMIAILIYFEDPIMQRNVPVVNPVDDKLNSLNGTKISKIENYDNNSKGSFKSPTIIQLNQSSLKQNSSFNRNNNLKSYGSQRDGVDYGGSSTLISSDFNHMNGNENENTALLKKATFGPNKSGGLMSNVFPSAMPTYQELNKIDEDLESPSYQYNTPRSIHTTTDNGFGSTTIPKSESFYKSHPSNGNGSADKLSSTRHSPLSPGTSVTPGISVTNAEILPSDQSLNSAVPLSSRGPSPNPNNYNYNSNNNSKSKIDEPDELYGDLYATKTFTLTLDNYEAEEVESSDLNCWEHISLEVHILLLLYVVNKTGQEMSVSSIPLLTSTMFHWNDETSGYFMAFMGALVLPCNIFVNSLMKDIEARDMILRLSYATLASSIILLDVDFIKYSSFQYMFGSCLLFCTLNSLEGIMMALLSKLVSPELAKGVFNSGLLATEAGTFGRVIGDFAITACGVSKDNKYLVNMLYIPLTAFIGLSIMIIHKFFDNFEV